MRKPVCAPGLSETTDALYLHWRALGVNHEYAMPLGVGEHTTFVACPHHLGR